MQSMMLGLMALLMPVASAVQAASLPQSSQAAALFCCPHSAVDSQVEVAIHTTGAHPFWSETRHAWVSARDLQAGEELRSQDGEELRVASLGRIPGEQAVYNLTVETEHVYFVSEAGVLVHNGTLGDCNLTWTKARQSREVGDTIKYAAGDKSAMDHIKDGHFFDSRPGESSSRFSQRNSRPGKIKGLVQEAVAKGNHTSTRPGDYSVTHRFNEVIGTDNSGRGSRTLRVYLDGDGNIFNAYPIEDQ
jgi:Pretoxin HINT domain